MFGDGTSQRLFELFTDHAIILRTQQAAIEASFNCDREPRAPLGSYSQSPTRNFIFASLYPELKARPQAPLLPTEHGPVEAAEPSASAWVDPVSQTIIIRDHPATLSVSMHWRSYTVAPPGQDHCSASVKCRCDNICFAHYLFQEM